MLTLTILSLLVSVVATGVSIGLQVSSANDAEDQAEEMQAAQKTQVDKNKAQAEVAQQKQLQHARQAAAKGALIDKIYTERAMASKDDNEQKIRHTGTPLRRRPEVNYATSRGNKATLEA